jgi:hypothetical protein
MKNTTHANAIWWSILVAESIRKQSSKAEQVYGSPTDEPPRVSPRHAPKDKNHCLSRIRPQYECDVCAPVEL